MKRLLLCIVAVVCLPILLRAGPIPLTGTIQTPQGTLLTGRIDFTLSYAAARDTSANNIIVASRVSFPVRNGALASNAQIVPNSVLSPGNTTYLAEYFNGFGQKIAQNNFFISGQSFNLGTATPTTITTSNISFANGGTTIDCSGLSGATASAKITTCANNLPSTGGTVDGRGFIGTVSWNSDAFAGITKPIDFLCGATTYNVTATSTLPANVHLIAGEGCIFSISGGITFTVNGPTDGSALQATSHFTGGVIVLAPPQGVGYTDHFQFINKSLSSNYYAAVDSNDCVGATCKFKIGAGGSPAQLLVPSIVITPPGNQVDIGPVTNGSGITSSLNAMLGVTSNNAYGQNDWLAWFMRDGSIGGGANSLVRIQHFGASGPQPILAGLGARGTEAVPSALQNGDQLLILSGRGFDGSATNWGEYAPGWSDDSGTIMIKAGANFSGTNHATYIPFFNSLINQTINPEHARLDTSGRWVVYPTNTANLSTTNPTDVANGAIIGIGGLVSAGTNLNTSVVYINGVGADGNSQIVTTHSGIGSTKPLEIFSDSTIDGVFTTNGGNGSLLINTPSTDFTSCIFCSRGTMAVITTSVGAQVLAFNASGGDGKNQIVSTHTGGASTQPLEIFTDSALQATFNISPVGMSVNGATGTGNFNSSGSAYFVGLTAEGSTQAALCQNTTTKEVQVNTGVATCTVSSLQFKDWIEDIDCSEALRIVKGMRPAVFKDKTGGDGPRFGFAAEWTEAVEPRLVDYDNGKPRAVDYERYSAVLTKAMQCQMAEK